MSSRNLPPHGRGFEPGDLIIKLNNRAIAGLKDARAALAKVRPRDSLSLIVRRGAMSNGRELKLTLTPEEGL